MRTCDTTPQVQAVAQEGLEPAVRVDAGEVHEPREPARNRATEEFTLTGAQQPLPQSGFEGGDEGLGAGAPRDLDEAVHERDDLQPGRRGRDVAMGGAPAAVEARRMPVGVDPDVDGLLGTGVECPEAVMSSRRKACDRSAVG
ncbi:hypothetical protein M4I32_11580 [Microbacterium sp. LRZ72]|uniref:hypothetical protein n=1 Tax=Microbacterium sp. LRZ72 TaxID=2942481 RepID=UPI0029BA6AFD|nr:hypothetical protein [Microbacterium sp. LRZ72]MDX2377441.1 hypothetical protein [Microbacterium sp. LRZ72]